MKKKTRKCVSSFNQIPNQRIFCIQYASTDKYIIHSRSISTMLRMVLSFEKKKETKRERIGKELKAIYNSNSSRTMMKMLKSIETKRTYKHIQIITQKIDRNQKKLIIRNLTIEMQHILDFELFKLNRDHLDANYICRIFKF